MPLKKSLIWYAILMFLLVKVVDNQVHSNFTHGGVKWFAIKIPEGANNPNIPAVRRKIVLYHNFFRSKILASNMLLMSWHKGAALKAKNLAAECKYLVHSTPEENTVKTLGTCGQNLFASEKPVPWFFPIKEWFNEKKYFHYGKNFTDISIFGHYTQMIWATSYKVGCALHHCPGGPWGQFYNYVCNYCPVGNILETLQYPHKKGKHCEDCPNDCIMGRLCTNACPYVDVYSNCEELSTQYKDFCTNIAKTECNATCHCKGKIHKVYPWGMNDTELRIYKAKYGLA